MGATSGRAADPITERITALPCVLTVRSPGWHKRNSSLPPGSLAPRLVSSYSQSVVECSQLRSILQLLRRPCCGCSHHRIGFAGTTSKCDRPPHARACAEQPPNRLVALVVARALRHMCARHRFLPFRASAGCVRVSNRAPSLHCGWTGVRTTIPVRAVVGSILYGIFLFPLATWPFACGIDLLGVQLVLVLASITRYKRATLG